MATSTATAIDRPVLSRVDRGSAEPAGILISLPLFGSGSRRVDSSALASAMPVETFVDWGLVRSSRRLG